MDGMESRNNERKELERLTNLAHEQEEEIEAINKQIDLMIKRQLSMWTTTSNDASAQTSPGGIAIQFFRFEVDWTKNTN